MEENAVRSNLPAQLTSFVGRQEEVREIMGLLKTSRLVVLTGAGGTGKTRLALQVATELTAAYRDGVWLVELANNIYPALVANAIAEALKANPIGEVSPLEALKRFLRRKHLLLLLDNFEHLPEATPLVGELLAAAPHLTILATSRERLHQYELAAEQMRRGLFIFRELGTGYGLAIALASLAGPIAKLGDYEKAARLLGAADAELESLGTNQQPVDQVGIGQFRSSVREALGEDAFQEAWQAGHDLSIDEALEYALGSQ